ncbi:MBL fold metallo-hydrolase [Herpetosiphon sp. NSE202]|uniref:MBL fold metallo-hydrolase n=1 Tax=Herpetosiphon sp. NSE202 TaxID=3351349 RepID=UPI00362B438C
MMQVPLTQLSDQIAMIDNGLLTTDGFGATYVVQGDQVALIETGTSLTAEATLAGLQQLGIDPAAVEHILLTHVHMDHSGGAGILAQHLPNAKVYLHSMTAAHLAEPSKLMRSVERAVGPMWQVYGTMLPIEAERILPAEHLSLNLGKGIVLEAVPTPGHSPDHLAFWEANSGTLWAGDSIGILMSTYNLNMPVTPPPAFNLADQLQAFQTLAKYPIRQLLPSHFGPTVAPPALALEEMHERLVKIVRDVRDNLHAAELPVEAIVEQALPTKEPVSPALNLVLWGNLAMSVHGLKLFFDRNPQAVELI